ncbi:Dolichyl-phosphate-mannose-protein mannosyltransferase [Pseudobutyrivibrio sp. 49]|uniref:hypothetical protein n=1 Tax=Pseudobutyrivibrio sp. 49 TaxID=1855344 RepID=UPI00089065FC|nr:hypothetical protein [Pseudobutyrivibrio sp. 49]SDH43952.1 Dolichyl-phosphate-mannose-protein mannosyltransferase [Pseudobutyrivibrio sp. 49]
MNKEKIVSQFLLFLCIGIVLLHAVFVCKEKQSLNLDESISFQFANDGVIEAGEFFSSLVNGSISDYSAQLSSKVLGTNNWVSQSEIDDEYTAINKGRFNIFSAYYINAGDVHPPFYYTCLNIISSIFSVLNIYSIGLILNIVALTIVCGFLYLMGCKLFENRAMALISVLYYGLSFGFINSASLFRMYALLTMWCVILVYLYISWYDAGFNYDNNTFKKICAVEFMGMLTQYFALFYIVPLFLITLIVMYLNKISLKKYLIGNIITGVLYLIAWPFFLMHVVFSDRGHDVTSNLSNGGILRRIYYYRGAVIEGLFADNNVFFIFVVIISIIVVGFYIYRLIREHNFKEQLTARSSIIWIYCFVPALIYFVIAACSVPWFVDRYIMPIMPAVSMLIVFFVYQALGLVLKHKNICAVLIIGLTVFLCVYWHKEIKPYYLYNSADRIAYNATCKDTDAIVIDVDYEVVNFEVETNFKHPNILEMDSNHISDIGSMIDKNDDYTLYVRKEKIEESEIEDYFKSIGYKMDVIDFDTDFYRIYKLHH